MWKQHGPRNHLQRRISKFWGLLLSSFWPVWQPRPRNFSCPCPYSLNFIFLVLGLCRCSYLHRSQANQGAAAAQGEYNTRIQVWGGFRTVSSGHSLKHPPLNTAMNSPTDLTVKIILCISSFWFLCSFIHLIYLTCLLPAPVIPVDVLTLGYGRVIRGVRMFLQYQSLA